jgi:uncharacterized iron-regulated membrane protein
LFTKILWFTACALVPFFAVTGVILWRHRIRRRRSFKKPEAETPGWGNLDTGVAAGA